MQDAASSARVRSHEARDRLVELLQRFGDRGACEKRARRRVNALQDRCSAARDAIFERRIDAADLRYGTIEASQRIKEAWCKMNERFHDLSVKFILPEETALCAELERHAADLADLRREKVLQSVILFQVDLSCDPARIQGLPLPRFLHSFNSDGSAAERLAMTQLARLTAFIAKVLNINVPFRLDFRPSHCNILSGKDGRVALALSPPSPAAVSSAITTLSNTAAAGSDPSLPSDTWVMNYRRALHLLALNVRHLMLTQLDAGTEEKTYRKICATNDIAPSVTLRTLAAISRQARLGYGDDLSCEVCSIWLLFFWIYMAIFKICRALYPRPLSAFSCNNALVGREGGVRLRRRRRRRRRGFLFE